MRVFVFHRISLYSGKKEIVDLHHPECLTPLPDRLLSAFPCKTLSQQGTCRKPYQISLSVTRTGIPIIMTTHRAVLSAKPQPPPIPIRSVPPHKSPTHRHLPLFQEAYVWSPCRNDCFKRPYPCDRLLQTVLYIARRGALANGVRIRSRLSKITMSGHSIHTGTIISLSTAAGCSPQKRRPQCPLPMGHVDRVSQQH